MDSAAAAPVTIITGAASGIGRQLALDLLGEGGHRLVLCDLDEVGLERNFGNAAVRLSTLNVTKLDDWRKLFESVVAEYGRVDILCNIAGIIIPGWVHEQAAAAIDQHIDVNVKGVMYGSKLASEIMVRQGSGHIVNMSSLSGVGFTPGNALYSGSKHAVRGFTISLAAELRDRGVYASCVCPGVVDTHMLDVQVDRPEGAISFTTGDPLTTGQVSKVLRKVIAEKSVEACLPNPFFAKLVDVFPSLSIKLYRSFEKRGLKTAAGVRKKKAGAR